MRAYLHHLALLPFVVNCMYGQCLEKYKKSVSVTRSNSTKCDHLNNAWVCPTLKKALELNDLNSTYIKIFSTSEELSKRIFVFRVNTLAIVSNSTTLIKCESNAGSKLSFINSSNICIRGLSFKLCGGNHSNDVTVANTVNLHLSSAIFLRNIENLHINDTLFNGSAGYGIVMVEVLNAVFYRLRVEHNTPVSFMELPDMKYGGAVFVVSSKGQVNSHNKITFLNSDFTYNNAAVSGEGTFEAASSITEQPQNNIEFFKEKIHGKGGALSFYLWNKGFTVNLTIKNSFIHKNNALWGGGIYIELGNKSSGNIFVSKSNITENCAKYSGGGIQTNKNIAAEKNSAIYISGCLVSGNTAVVGGGLAQKHGLKPVISFCTFSENKAKLGAALYFERTTALLSSTNITQNAVSRPSNISSLEPMATTVVGVGALFAFQSQIVINGQCRISQNVNTGVVLSYSYFFVKGKAIFENNEGSKGGAISMYEESAVVLYDETYLVFKNNKANKGGALYAHIFGPTIPLWNSPELDLCRCFFQFDKTTSKNMFKGKVMFTDNDASKNDGNAIFTNSLLTCQKSRSKSEILLNWPNFNFTGNSSTFITTDPVKIITKEEEWNNIQPGMKFYVSLKLLDEMGQHVEAPVDISLEPEDKVSIKNSKIIISENKFHLEIFGERNTTFNVTIKSTSGRAPSIRIINKKLNFCSFALSFSSMTNSCTCVNTKNQDRMISRCVGKDIYLFKNTWAYPFQKAMDRDEETTQVCPHGYCNVTCSPRKDSPDCKYNYDHQCAENRNQSCHNYLCAACSANYSVVLGSEQCRDCRGKSKWWRLLLTSLAVIVTVLVVLWINVDVYKLLLNSVIFYYQVVYLVVAPEQEIGKFMKAIIGSINLRGLRIGGGGFCVYDGLNDLHKIMLNYLFPLLMIITLVCVILFAENCPCTLPFEQVNTFRAILFVMVFAYSDITRITLDLLVVVEIDGVKRVRKYAVMEYMHGFHFGCAVAAIIVLIVFVLGVPLALIAPSVSMEMKWERCNCVIHNRFYVSFVKPLLESFLSVFKKNLSCQLFSAFYFLFRLILLLLRAFMKRDQFQLTVMASFCFMMFVLFSKVKPYRDEKYNYFDMFILFNLTSIAVISNSKLRLTFMDNENSYASMAIMALLWLPLPTWSLALCVIYWEKIFEKLSAICFRLRRHDYTAINGSVGLVLVGKQRAYIS